MGYTYRTNLSCTNPELLASGSTFNQTTKSEIIKIKGNEVHYHTYCDTMYDELLELSIKYPKEKFFITYWDDDYYSCEQHSGVFSEGIYHETTIDPKYRFQYSKNTGADQNLVDEFIDKISKYLDAKKYQKDHSDPMIYYQIPNAEECHDGLKASVKYIWETEDHRFIGENIYYHVIEISYENKDKENLKRLKLENENLKHQLDDTIGFDDLPF